MTAARTQGVARHILRDEEEPGDKLGPGPITDAVAIETEKDVLRQVLGFLAIAKPAVEMAEYARPIPGDEFVECILIPLADAEHENDLGVAEVGILGAKSSATACGTRADGRGWQACLQSSESGGREAHAKRAALALGAFDGDGAAHQVDVALDDGQAQPRVQAVGAARGVGSEETLENMLPGFRADADAGVLDFDFQAPVVAGY